MRCVVCLYYGLVQSPGLAKSQHLSQRLFENLACSKSWVSISSRGRVFSPEIQASSFIQGEFQACIEICTLLEPCDKYSHRVVQWIRKIVTQSKNCNSLPGYWLLSSQRLTLNIYTLGFGVDLNKLTNNKHFLSFPALNDLNLQYNSKHIYFWCTNVK